MKRPRFHNLMAIIGGLSFLSLLVSATFFVFWMLFTDFEINMVAVKWIVGSAFMTFLCYLLDDIYA